MLSPFPFICCRVCLAGASTQLRHASLAWFPEVVVATVPEQEQEVERLAVWLRARQGGCRRRRGGSHLLLPPSFSRRALSVHRGSPDLTATSCTLTNLWPPLHPSIARGSAARTRINFWRHHSIRCLLM